MPKYGTSLMSKIEDWLSGRPGPADFPALLSMHIPKTAGLAFREILYQQYGPTRVLAINQYGLLRQGQTLSHHFRKRHRVIHGHLPYTYLKPLHGPDTMIITWLRDPAQRVVSNYYYSITHEFPKRLRENPDRKMMNLEEFIERPKRQNVMSRFLEGIELEDLDFFGFQEDFVDGLDRLAEQVGWTLTAQDRTRRVNDNRQVKAKYPTPSPETLRRIRQLNQADIELYERARQLWRERYA
ncbi:MAG: sulfotransferase family 2 domain-containing protein [Bacteroidetes bacterium]|jgi:hypothetical protein|nr:sulfotransferase family 2 domain-containing protein [Bacteroidota bacterium]